jgi:soluble lytic murein transglycosylase-like protein
MKALFVAAAIAAGLSLSHAAVAGEAEYAEMVAAHARANGVPAALVHRVIVRESRYQPHLIGHGGTIGLMQISDPETNLTYAVKYLAGAYRAANGDYGRAIRYYAGGYYYAAKQQPLQVAQQADSFGHAWLEPNGNPQPMLARHKRLARNVTNARAQAPK